ncbi:MAG TPA: hypothetical protein VG897_13060 [Terriglobales bacterium]|jgi:hypothetical protein|nr:hypothetical protein [Terriglobales bacterium]
MVLNHGNVDREIDERFPTIHLSKINDKAQPQPWLGFFVALCRRADLLVDNLPFVCIPAEKLF